jgi:hypothetical protein
MRTELVLDALEMALIGYVSTLVKERSAVCECDRWSVGWSDRK